VLAPRGSSRGVLRVFPHDECGPAVRRVVVNIVLENGPHRKTVLELEAQCRVVEITGDDPFDILGGGKLMLVIGEARQVRARDDPALLESIAETTDETLWPRIDPKAVRVKGSLA